jgi:peptidyl-prolyl cis-trans isomerase SurA
MTDHPRFSARLRQGLRLPHWAALLLCAPLLWSGTATAQTLRASNQFHSLQTASSVGPKTANFIVALVNSEPVTNHEVRQRLLRLEQRLIQQGEALPPRADLAREVLEQLVMEMVQLQHASELGLRVDEATLLQAEQSIAEQNQLSLEDFRRRVAEQGLDIHALRRDLTSQILLQRVREREVQARLNVSESDIDSYIRNRQSNLDPSQQALNLAHVLVQVPEGAPDALVRERQARAQAVADRARNGHDFAALARDFSDAPERSNGGEFGLRPADRLPDLFVQAVQTVPIGGIAGPIRSAAGFHVLKVLEKTQLGLPDMVIIQTRARHILLRTGPQLSQEAAVARLGQLRTQILSGQASFPALAREHSQDGSAREGGDLGWANPGQFVPEFEAAMNALRNGEISQPLVSRFGVHLIRVDERREYTLSPREQRERVRELVREEKAIQAVEAWAQDVRSRAFVEYREDPQL